MTILYNGKWYSRVITPSHNHFHYSSLYVRVIRWPWIAGCDYEKGTTTGGTTTISRSTLCKYNLNRTSDIVFGFPWAHAWTSIVSQQNYRHQYSTLHGPVVVWGLSIQTWRRWPRRGAVCYLLRAPHALVYNSNQCHARVNKISKSKQMDFFPSSITAVVRRLNGWMEWNRTISRQIRIVYY